MIITMKIIITIMILLLILMLLRLLLLLIIIIIIMIILVIIGDTRLAIGGSPTRAETIHCAPRVPECT